MKELAERTTACKGWRWMPGMLALDTGLRLDEMTDDWEAELPDLNDPATLGCLLMILREVRGMCACYETVVGWRVYSTGGTLWSQGKSEAEALVKALEDAG